MRDSLDWAERYPATLTDKLAAVPSQPGCYLMKEPTGHVIYVGKAKVLRSRVRSYFQQGAELTRRMRRMVYEVADIDWIVTDSELEALILESNLIKKHKPTYNVRLRDDKSYPYIAVTLSEEWPRTVFMRKLRMKRSEVDRFYGPYTDSEAVREMLRLIRRVFRVPCGWKNPDQSKGKACLYYHIGQCTGACVGKVTKDEYMAAIRDVMAFLEGRRDELVEKMLSQMDEASQSLEFERAAKLRDGVATIQKLAARQKVISTALEDQDVIALVTDNGNTCAEMFFIRGGKLIGQEHFLLENASADDLSESLREFIERYYDTAPYIPREVLLGEEITEIDVMESWLRRKKGSTTDLVTPKRGEKKKLVDMARRNAELVLKQLRLRMDADEDRVREDMTALQRAIGSDIYPSRIEAYDISNIQGQHTVASLVVFENGRPKKEHYRRFKIRYSEGSPDDYASMREVIARRLTGALRGTRAFEELPDLILIDGGKGQLNAAMEVISGLEEQVAAIGLAKRNEEIFTPGRPDPILLPRDSGALHALQRVRDEAHRFAITYHRGIRGKTMRMSVLNDIPGIGPKRRKALVRHFGSIEKIKEASVEQLAETPGMTEPSAKAVYAFFQQTGAEG